MKSAPTGPAVWRPVVFFFVLTLACYLANFRTTPHALGGDTIPNRLLPFSVLRFGTLNLDPFRADMRAAGGWRWYIQERDGHLVSFYPIGTSIIALPVYVPLYLGLAATGPVSSTRLFAASPIAEKIASSVFAALTSGIFYLLARRRVKPMVAFWTTLAFGLASSIWATASQLLWQHSSVVLMLTVACWLLTWPERPAWSLAGAGFALGLAVLARPSAALFALAGLGCAFAGGGDLAARLRRVLLFGLAAFPVAAFNLLYNWTYFDSPFGGYGWPADAFSLASLSRGAAGLLVSPNRGLLVFTPIALLGILKVGESLVRPARDPLLSLFGLAAVAHLALIGSYREWAGGWSFGPRYLVDILPILGLAGAEMWVRLPRAGRPLVWIALVWSILVQLDGAFAYPASGWDSRMSNPGPIEQAAWSWQHFSLWEDLRAWWDL